MNHAPAVSWWRIGGAVVVLGVLVYLGTRLAPVYVHNYELQRFVEETTQRVENHTKSDDLLRTWVVEKAGELDLPVKAGNVQIRRLRGSLRIDIRYMVRVDLPLYTVDLHFYPGAGSQ